MRYASWSLFHKPYLLLLMALLHLSVHTGPSLSTLSRFSPTDLIFTGADARVFRDLLADWQLLEIEDPKEFIRGLVPRVRQCMIGELPAFAV